MKKCVPPQFMTLGELVEYARISKRTIYRLLRQGTITLHRIGSDVRFCKSEVDRLIAKRTKEE
jgi:excisionase family DNA binding protein